MLHNEKVQALIDVFKEDGTITGINYKKELETKTVFQVSYIQHNGYESNNLYVVDNEGNIELFKKDTTHHCIFENRYCRYANKNGSSFTCEAPNDNSMKCK